MKNALLLILMGLTFFSCGPSEQEIQLEKEKAIADSIKIVVVQQEKRENQIKREKSIADSVAKVYQRRLDEKVSSPIELRQDLISVERGNSLRYLSVDFKIDYNVFSGKDVIKGKIINNATLARFKDIQLELYCYSRTKTLIKTMRLTFYDYVEARSRSDFNHKFKSPKGTKTISVKIIGATPA